MLINLSGNPYLNLWAAFQIQVAVDVLQVKFKSIDWPIITVFGQVKVIAADEDTRMD